MNKTTEGQGDFPCHHGTGLGYHNFIERSKLIEEGLEDGSLTVRVAIRIPNQRCITNTDEATTISSVDVGRPMQWSEPVSTIVKFHQVERLDSTKGVLTCSPDFQVLGFPWCLRLYLGGDSQAMDGFVSCFLKIKQETSTPVITKFSVSHSTTELIQQHDFVGSAWGTGTSSFMKKSDLIVVGGLFQLKVTIQIQPPKPKIRSLPKVYSQHLDMARLLRSKQGADVVFDFGNGNELHAHSVILSARAPFLSKFAQGETAEGGTTTVPMEGTSSDTFMRLLDFLYTDRVSFSEDLAEEKDLLKLANKFRI